MKLFWLNLVLLVLWAAANYQMVSLSRELIQREKRLLELEGFFEELNADIYDVRERQEKTHKVVNILIKVLLLPKLPAAQREELAPHFGPET